jgi:hypothetical protein
MGKKVFSESSVPMYGTTRRHIPKLRDLNSLVPVLFTSIMQYYFYENICKIMFKSILIKVLHTIKYKRFEIIQRPTSEAEAPAPSNLCI